MFTLLISPFGFAPTKVGYNQYVKAGGSMEYASFKVFERRTAKEIAAEKITRFYAAMHYYYDQSIYYKSIGDQAQYELMVEACDIRAKQLGEAHRELVLLESN
jgi:hypothetical protein